MKRFLLLLGATPLFLLVVALIRPTEFYGDYPGWEAVEELADKYDLEIGTQNVFGPSDCSTAYRIYSAAIKKDKNIDSWPKVRDKPLLKRVRAWAYHACLVNGHKDWLYGVIP